MGYLLKTHTYGIAWNPSKHLYNLWIPQDIEDFLLDFV